jgi:hypothetical protein
MIRSKCLVPMSSENPCVLLGSRLIRVEQLDQPQEINEQPRLASNTTGQMPFSGDIFRDFDFNAQTFFDPFWFVLEF